MDRTLTGKRLWTEPGSAEPAARVHSSQVPSASGSVPASDSTWPGAIEVTRPIETKT